MTPSPPTADNFLAGGEGNPAGEGPGAEVPSPAGRICDVIGCGRPHQAKGLCQKHYQAWHRGGEQPEYRPGPAPLVVVVPDDMVPLVAELVENDARPLFMLLWRAIGNWHLQGNDIAS